MLDFIFEIFGEFFVEGLFGGIAHMLSGWFGTGDHQDTARLSVVPRPSDLGLAKGGR